MPILGPVEDYLTRAFESDPTNADIALWELRDLIGAQRLTAAQAETVLAKIDSILTEVRPGQERQKNDAQWLQGVMYLHGNGCNQGADAQKPADAYRCFEEGGRSNHAKSIFYWGRCHELGVGTPMDPAKAKTYYLQAAELKLPEAMEDLSIFSIDGVSHSEEENALWKHRALLNTPSADTASLERRYNLLALVGVTTPIALRDPLKAHHCIALFEGHIGSTSESRARGYLWREESSLECGRYILHLLWNQLNIFQPEHYQVIKYPLPLLNFVVGKLAFSFNFNDWSRVHILQGLLHYPSDPLREKSGFKKLKNNMPS